MGNRLSEILNAPIIFRSRPEPIPGDLRPLWRIGLILLILRIASRGRKSSFARLHVLNWAVRTQKNRDVLRRVSNGDIPTDSIVVRIEPSLNRAVDLACAEGLVEVVGGDRVRLTAAGNQTAGALVTNDSVFPDEKIFLGEVGKIISEGLVDGLFAKE